VRATNTEERNKVFLKFMFLFILTVTLIVLAFFYGVKLPVAENRMLRQKIQVVEAREEKDKLMLNEMQRIKGLLDTLDLPGVNTEYVQHIITGKLAEMERTLPQNDSTYRKKMYSNMIQTYLELKNAKQSLIKLKDMKTTLDEYTEMIEKYKMELEQAQRDLDICRQLGRGR